MKKIKVTFKSSNSVIGTLHDNETANIIYESLPLESTAIHSRWSGREVNFTLNLKGSPKRENQSIYTSIGDICYWRDWRNEANDTMLTKHVVAIYYGSEHARSHIGDEPVNIFGKIDEEYIEKIKQIGENIWLTGTEIVRIEKCEA